MAVTEYDVVGLLQTSTTTTNPAAGASFDLQPYIHAGGPQAFGVAVYVSAAASTTGVYTVSIYDSTDGTTFSTTALGTTSTTTTGTARVDVTPGLNRYIHAQAAQSGTSPNFTAVTMGLFLKRNA